MGDQVIDNVYSFNTVSDVHHHRKVLDFINDISIENSMAFLPLTIHHPAFEQEDYIEFLYEYVKDEVDYLLSEISQSDPKLFKPIAESLNEQLKKSKQLIRLNFVLTLINQDDTRETEIHELVVMWDEISQSYVLINYGFNHDCLVAIATKDYLDPDLFFVDDAPITMTIPLKS